MSDEMKPFELDYDLPHPPEKVWRVLTEPELLGRWLMANDIKAVVGHKFTFRAAPGPGWDGVVHCEVLVVDPPRTLKYTWVSGSDDPAKSAFRLDTTVTWTLAPTPAGTRLHLVHAGFRAENGFAYQGMSKGWAGRIAERLAEVLAE